MCASVSALVYQEDIPCLCVTLPVSLMTNSSTENTSYKIELGAQAHGLEALEFINRGLVVQLPAKHRYWLKATAISSADKHLRSY